MTPEILHGKGFEIFVGDNREGLRRLPEQSVHVIVTSPPYFALRSYDVPASVWGGDKACLHEFQREHYRLENHGDVSRGPVARAESREARDKQHYNQRNQARTTNTKVGLIEAATCTECGAWLGRLGHEKTPELYIAHLVEALDEAYRVLRDDGLLWVNIGDKYFHKGGILPARADHSHGKFLGTRGERLRNERVETPRRSPSGGLRSKELIGIPWMLVFAMREAGWILRSENIWAKKSFLPDSVNDRPSRAHEQVFQFSKKPVGYFYDKHAALEAFADARQGRDGGTQPSERNRGGRTDGFTKPNGIDPSGNGGKNMRTVWRELDTMWDLGPEPFKGEHTATFPTKLVEKMILVSTSERGVCPICGAPWVRLLERGAVDAAQQKACGADAAGQYAGQATKDYAGEGAQDASDTKRSILASFVKKRTIGWKPTCGCSPEWPTQADCGDRPSNPEAWALLDALRAKGRMSIPEDHILCADPTCRHNELQHGRAGTQCGRCRCSCFRNGDPYEPVPAVVLDLFSGMATSGVVAIRHGRRYLGVELGEKYAKGSVERLEGDQLTTDFGRPPKDAEEKQAMKAQLRLFEEA
jgi:DNA modification methylase